VAACSRLAMASAAVITSVPIPWRSIHSCSPSAPFSAAMACTSCSAACPPSLSGSPTPGGGRFFLRWSYAYPTGLRSGPPRTLFAQRKPMLSAEESAVLPMRVLTVT